MQHHSEKPRYLLRLLLRGGEVLGAFLSFLLVHMVLMRTCYLGSNLPVRLVEAIVQFLKPEVFANCEAGMSVWMLDEILFWSIPLLVLWGWLLPRRIFLPFSVLYAMFFILFAWGEIT